METNKENSNSWLPLDKIDDFVSGKKLAYFDGKCVGSIQLLLDKEETTE